MAIESRLEQLKPEIISPAIEAEKFVSRLQSTLTSWQQNKMHDQSTTSYNFALSTIRKNEYLSVTRGRSGIESITLKTLEETPPSEIKHLGIRTGTLLNPQTAIFNPDGNITIFGDNPKDPKKTVIMQISPKGECTARDHFSPAK